MSISEQEWQSEQQRVNHVVERINRRVEVLQENVSEVRQDITEFRKHFWDDVKLNLDDVDEAGETSITLKQQSELLSERERSLRHAEKEYQKLRRLQDTPYFGRIDFSEDGEPSVDHIYIGIGSFLDEESDHFLVYDWRAPVSSLYYDYGTGLAQFETPGGTVSGEIELKRQFRIRDGRIRNLFDTGVTIGDELLQEVLSRQSDAHMKSIVATIQREQNRIIRNERNRLLIVQGAAGSGKTSAALQRVAYLLYRYRETLSAEQIVLFSPNGMFNSYVSTVLPELGEENMGQTTFQDYLEHRLGRTFAMEDPFVQMEYTLTAMNEPGYEARLAGIRYKASLAFMEVIERYAAFLGQCEILFTDVLFRYEVCLSADEIRAQFDALPNTLPIPNRMKLLTESLLQQVED
ncbi:MAG: RNA polymerase recycling motor HelD, partial [Tumebacillaceae bacterium]